MQTPAITLVDAFTRGLATATGTPGTPEPFTGNPAAVCRLAAPADPTWMQALATELGYSETAFLVPSAPGRWQLRWFTPAAEVALCGHATLAAAHVLWQQEPADTGGVLRFDTASGELTAGLRDGLVWLDFPRIDLRPEHPDEQLPEWLGCMPMHVAVAGEDLFVELPDADAVRGCRPDLDGLRQLPHRGIIVTAAGEAATEADGPHCVSRFFAPRVGIDEDPVTGSAHCAIGPYWAGRLYTGHLLAEQASRRGGRLRLVVGDERVQLGGLATTVLSGALADRPPAEVGR